MIRAATVAVAAVLLFVVSHVDVTVPALSLLGLVAWAVAASVLAVVIYLRTTADPKDPR